MRTKLKRAIAFYNGFKGDATLTAIINQVPANLINTLTGKQIAIVMELINNAFHNGKKSCGAEAIDVDCVWVDSIQV